MPSCLNDWIASPNPDKCAAIFNRLPGREISHHFENAPGRLVEIHPELGMTPDAIAEKCQREDYGLVLDTEHIVRGFRENDPRYGLGSPLLPGVNAMETTITALAPHIQVVHIKSMTGLYMLRDLFRADHRDEIDFVAEYPPLLRGPWAVQSYMREFLIGMRKLAHGK